MAVQESMAMCKMNEFPRRHFYVPFGEFVHLHMQYYSFTNSILKCAVFPFLTPARKPPTTFYFTNTSSTSLASLIFFSSVLQISNSLIDGSPILIPSFR